MPTLWDRNRNRPRGWMDGWLWLKKEISSRATLVVAKTILQSNLITRYLLRKVLFSRPFSNLVPRVCLLPLEGGSLYFKARLRAKSLLCISVCIPIEIITRVKISLGDGVLLWKRDWGDSKMVYRACACILESPKFHFEAFCNFQRVRTFTYVTWEFYWFTLLLPRTQRCNSAQDCDHGILEKGRIACRYTARVPMGNLYFTD